MKAPTAPTAEDIKGMLAVIPPSADYDTRLRIASAVFSELPLAEGCQLLNAWSPEKSPGWYASKHRYRLQRVGIGTLIHLARRHGWKGARRKGGWNGKIGFATFPAGPLTPLPPTRSTFVIPPVSATPTPPAGRTYSPIERHAAEQLRRIHKAGFITGPDDPDARTFAAAFVLLEATAEL